MGLFFVLFTKYVTIKIDDSDEFLMKRRDFFKLVSLPLLVCSCAKPLSHLADKKEGSALLGALNLEDISPGSPIKDQHFHNLSKKNVNFDADYPDDVLCPVHQRAMLDSVIKKFRMSQRHIGNGNFNLTSMDEFFNSLKYAPSSERLTKEEIKFIEELFYFDAKKYGRVRLFGSIGFLFTVFLAGAWFEYFGMQHFPGWTVLSLVAVTASVWLLPDLKEATSTSDVKEAIWPVLRQKHVLWFFVTAFFHVLWKIRGKW